MADRKIDPKQQFSKKLAGRAEWFWFFYMVLLAVVLVLQPKAALEAVYLGIMVTVVMVASVCAYTKNSIDEKWFFWLAEIAKAVSGKKNTDDSSNDMNDNDDSSGDEGEGGNG